MTVRATAPGRLDVMGGIADYSGSLVLQMPIAEQARCSTTTRDDGMLVIESTARPDPLRMDMDRIVRQGDLASYAAARDYFRLHRSRHWASYAMGVLVVLGIEEGLHIDRGLTIQIDSDVPEGKGVSSSAAIEVSVMRSVLQLLGVEMDPRRVAGLCQVAENQVAGAPCGIMDQMTASCGRRGSLMRLLCQPAELEGFIDLPPGVSVWGIDSGLRHAVTGSDYSSVRAAARMGLRIIEHASGREAEGFNGYLANVGPDLLRHRYVDLLPERMTGADFLRDFDHIDDEVVAVDPEATYLVRAATSHPILEHDRISRFASWLDREHTEERLAMAGELMYLSHAGYSSCGLGSDGTDLLVDMVKKSGVEKGLYGARVTGGGSGGTVAVLGRTGAEDLVRAIARDYQKQTGRYAQVF